MLILLFTACESKSPDEEEKDGLSEAIQTEENTVDLGDRDPETEAIETKTDDQDKEEPEVGLLDKALLKSIKISPSNTFKSVGEISGIQDDGTKTYTQKRTDYRKGYSTRHEIITEEHTFIDIYNEDEGISYSYTLGEITGRMDKDDEEDILDLEKGKAMVGESLLTAIEDQFAGAENIEIAADKDTVLGRKAIRVEIMITTEAGDIDKHVIYYDREYSEVLKAEIEFGDGKLLMTYSAVEFNPKLDDRLFEAPKDVTFTE
jgi:outer membrane lipoprotein-sorting protein